MSTASGRVGLLGTLLLLVVIVGAGICVSSARAGNTIIPGPMGGLGQAQPACMKGWVLTCNGTTCTCTNEIIAADGLNNGISTDQIDAGVLPMVHGGTARTGAAIGIECAAAAAYNNTKIDYSSGGAGTLICNGFNTPDYSGATRIVAGSSGGLGNAQPACATGTHPDFDGGSTWCAPDTYPGANYDYEIGSSPNEIWQLLPLGVVTDASGVLGGSPVGKALAVKLVTGPMGATLDRIGVFQNANVTSAKAHFGIYAARANGYPGALVAGSDNCEVDLSTGSGGWKTCTINVTLAASTRYWAAFLPGGAAPNIAEPTSMIHTDYTSTSNEVYGLYVSQPYGSMPNPWPVDGGTLQSLTNVPCFIIRRSQ